MPNISGNVGAVFNGGTITGEFIVNRPGPGFTQAIAVQMPAGSHAAGSVVVEAKDENGNQIIFVDALGSMDFNLTDAGALIDFRNTAFTTLLRLSETGPSLKAPVGGSATISNDAGTGIGISDAGMGFFTTAPVAKPTGVAVSAAGIHAALVTLGLIAA